MTEGNPSPDKSTFDPEAQHHQRPKLRKVRGFPLQAQTQDGQNQVLLGLADAQQISSKIVAMSPAIQEILPLFDGEQDLDQIVSTVGKGLTREVLEGLVAQLDDAALLFGPNFEAILDEMRREFDSSSVLPPASTAQMAEHLVIQDMGEDATDEAKAEHGATKLAEMFDKWIDTALEKVEKPSFDSLPKAIIAPHIDYPRGWLNYASVWGRMRVVDRPARVIILGTNHFGQATGVCGCDKAYETPLGVCPLAQDIADAIREKLGPEDAERLFADRFDHEREHSVELQIPWIQHCLAADENGDFCSVFGVLVHDPAVNNGESYDGNGLALEPFIKALKAAIADLDGPTLVISSADLSHVGPAFGDQQALAGETPEAQGLRNKVAQHDREMLELITQGKTSDLVASMAWQQNPTRWCSTGNIVAALEVVEPTQIRLLNYAASMDPQGAAMVSNAALVMS